MNILRVLNILLVFHIEMSMNMVSKYKTKKITNYQLLNILIVLNALLVFLVAPLTSSSSPSPTSPSLRLSLWAGSKILGNLAMITMNMLMTKQHNLDDKK